MKAGDVSGGQTSSRESWLSAPLSDPNAALWASISPPANPNIATLVRRRAAGFSLDLLAQRLYLRFPERFSSRATARTAILSLSVAVGAALGAAGYLTLTSRGAPTIAANAGRATAAETALATTAPSAPLRRGQTELAEPAIGAASSTPAGALAPTARAASADPIAQPLRASPAMADATEPSAAPAKAKRSTAKKRGKATARRASKRRSRAALD